jgi:hypothetical protein
MGAMTIRLKRGRNGALKSINLGILIILWAVQYCSAQQADSIKRNSTSPSTSVNGLIVDAGTGQPLPFVTVAFSGSPHATSSNSRGQYSLATTGVFKEITISNIGYQTVIKTVQPGQVNTINIKLQATTSQLKEVKVSTARNPRYHNKGNPAVELIRRVIEHKEQNRMESADYLQYNQYERLTFSLFNLSPQFINGRFFRKYKFMLDSTQVISGEHQTTLPVFFSEKNYEHYYQKSPEKSINILQAQKEVNILKFIDTVGLDIYLKRLYGNNIDIYQNNIFIINHEFLSPIADNAPNFYKFFITDTLQNGKEKLIALSFTPRNKGDLLFEGKILITMDDHYAVKSCELNVNKQININFMRSLAVHQDFEVHPDGRYYLEKALFVPILVFRNKKVPAYLENVPSFIKTISCILLSHPRFTTEKANRWQFIPRGRIPPTGNDTAQTRCLLTRQTYMPRYSGFSRCHPLKGLPG